jgi:integrase
MPPTQRGSVRRLASGRHQLRYYDNEGKRQSGGLFPTRSAAFAHFRAAIEPQLRGEVAPLPDLTLAEFVEVYLSRHAVTVRPRTIRVLRERLRYATRAYGDVRLSALESMSGELADWRRTLPERSQYAIFSALRQTLGAALRWHHISENPAKAAGRNPQPPPRAVRPYTLAELEAIAAELSPEYEPLPDFAAATGLRPEEWIALERKQVDRRAGLVSVTQTVSDGEITPLAKTTRSRRQVPLSRRACAALDRLPARLDTPLLFPAPGGGLLDLPNFRRRKWNPAITSSGVSRPARVYDLRSTFASRALAASVTVFELARVMGTSVLMIERHYGALLDGAGAGIAGRLDAHEAAQEAEEAEQADEQ